ncbi:class F sortase [Streptomyces sp. FH025]|uniref:class F sortase n=1 Tax=Streptomyces sp. FH025 TaxID=2815937 RepID=UPI001FAEEC18|nr:class F sortase [Streptomyces sp. FH025]
MPKLLSVGLGAAAMGLLMIYNSVSGGPAAGPPASQAVPPAVAAITVPTPAGPATAPEEPAAPAAPAPVPAEPAEPAAPAPLALTPAKPTRLRIPQIGVDAPFTELTLDPAGQLNPPPPDDKNLVGWYREGVSPGELGAAVVAGHVDTTTGPAVFLMLSKLRPGSRVEVSRADGTIAVFAVDSVESFAKDAFPDQKVYGSTPDAQLRLITCGGTYDKSRKDYLNNVVVFAHLESSHPA